MSENIHLVFSTPPAEISDEQYNQWYDAHLGEILVVAGFTAARRFGLQRINGTDTPTEFPFLSMYEIEGDIPEIMEALRKEGTSGNMQLPDWFRGITFASWNCVQLGNTHGADVVMPDHAYLVFSTPPPELSFDDYSEWYAAHLEENVANSPLLRRGWRFGLEPAGPSPDAYRDGPAHLAMYELEGDAEDMRSGLHKKIEAGGIVLPQWFGGIRFASLDARALGGRVATQG